MSDTEKAAAPTTPKDGKPAGGGFADIGPRVASAIALVLAAGATLYVGGDVFVLFWLSAAFAVNWEWQGLIGGARRLARVIAGGVAVAAVAALAMVGLLDFAALAAVALAVVAGALAGPERRLWAFFGVVYAAVLIAPVCLLRQSETHGLLAIAWLFAIVWGTDIFAYFGGRLIGGPKLWPRVSAGKTWSGTLTGVFSGALLGVVAAYVGIGAAALDIRLFLLGFVAAAVSQIGDLVESSVKRRFGVKDSSNLIPGHGGVMDRLDGFIFAAALAGAVGLWRNAASPAAGLFLW